MSTKILNLGRMSLLQDGKEKAWIITSTLPQHFAHP